MNSDFIFLYIDAGTGSLIISLLTGLFLSLLYSIKNIYYNFLSFISGIKTNFKSDFSGKIVFYSENKSYWRVYEPIVLELIKNDQKFVYLSSDDEDPGLRIKDHCIETYYIGNINQSIFILNKLKSRLCVMTTPQIDVIALKRSKHVKHYCHVIHSPTDIHAYKKFAFDYYDSVLCSSESQIENLRYLEKIRGTKHKELFKTGCTYYDFFSKENENSGDSILIAPTWGDRTFFKQHGKRIIKILIDSGEKVIYRPHPQSWISDKDILNDVMNTYGSHPNFHIDEKVGGESSIQESKLLICDISSGMLYDMILVYQKPVISVDFDWKDGGYESSNLLNQISSISFLNDFGGFIKVDEIENISSIIKNVVSKKPSKKAIDNHIFNFKKCGKIAAEQIISINNKNI